MENLELESAQMPQMPAIVETDGRRAVNGRELHAWLEIKTRYNDWVKRMIEYGFEENFDFEVVTQKRVTTNSDNPITEFTNHAMSIQMAAEIAMMQRNERGRETRSHYLNMEQRFINQLQMTVVSLSNKVARLEANQAQLATSVHAVEAKQDSINEDYYTLSGYYALCKRKFDLSPEIAKMTGKALSKTSRKSETPILKKFDSKYGNVNQYHKLILANVLGF